MLNYFYHRCSDMHREIQYLAYYDKHGAREED